MKFYCPKCESEQITEVNKKGRHYYYCHSCMTISQRANNTSRPVVELNTPEGIKHAGAGAIIWHNGKILLIKRRMYPYCWATPGGHLEEGETPIESLGREILEETGIIIPEVELIYKGEIKGDRCRYGVDIHEWYLFSFEMPKDVEVFLSSESDGYNWFTPREALNLNLTVPVRYLIENVVIKGKKQTKVNLVSENNLITKTISPSYLLDKKSDLIYHLSKALFKVRNLDTILNSAVNETLAAFNSNTASIGLINNSSSEIIIKAIKRSDGESVPKNFKSFKNGQGIAGLCAEKKQTIIVEDTKKSKAYLGKDKEGSIVCIPIMPNEKLIGVLSVSYERVKQFSESEVQFLQILAGMIGLAIENSRLFCQSEAERELLDKVITNVNDGVAVINEEGKIIIWNRYIEEITHLSAHDTIALDYHDIFLNSLGLAKISVIIDSFFKSVNKAKDTAIEEEMTDKFGKKIWLNASFSSLQSNTHISKNIIIVLRNISKEKNLIQIKNEFITTTAHELRTPLTSIAGYLSMILHGDAGKLNNMQEKYFTRAYMSTERLTHLVEDVLETLRIEEDRVALNVQSFDVNKLILEVLDNLGSKAKAKSINIIFTKKKSTLIYADKIKTKHAIENIVDNAIKYTNDKGEVNITIGKNDDQVIISIKDSGVGIGKEHIQTIFDRFVRIPNKLSIKAGGTGLGLFIAKKLINKQQGDIWVESEKNKGTTFHITLPSFIK